MNRHTADCKLTSFILANVADRMEIRTRDNQSVISTSLSRPDKGHADKEDERSVAGALANDCWQIPAAPRRYSLVISNVLLRAANITWGDHIRVDQTGGQLPQIQVHSRPYAASNVSSPSKSAPIGKFHIFHREVQCQHRDYHRLRGA